MSEPVQRQTRFKSRNLFGVVAFLRKYPGRVAICLSMLLINLGIDVSLPQFIGDAITDLRRYVEQQVPFSPGPYVQRILSRVPLPTGVAYILGPMPDRPVQL